MTKTKKIILKTYFTLFKAERFWKTTLITLILSFTIETPKKKKALVTLNSHLHPFPEEPGNVILHNHPFLVLYW